jgi:hypothetical protein
MHAEWFDLIVIRSDKCPAMAGSAERPVLLLVQYQLEAEHADLERPPVFLVIPVQGKTQRSQKRNERSAPLTKKTLLAERFCTIFPSFRCSLAKCIRRQTLADARICRMAACLYFSRISNEVKAS